MIRIDIISAVPALLESPFQHSIVKRAQDKGLAKIQVHNLREYGLGKHRQIDDYAFGGGAGMVLMIEPISKIIEELKTERTYDEVIYMSPDGELMDQKICNILSLHQNLILLCGHYKGIDERIREHFITKEISIGNYVLTGGELAAAILTDGIIRLLPGVLGDEESALSDSFQDDLIAPPVYTKPSEFNGWKVPDILLGGNHKEIDAWKMEKSIERTQKRRPNLGQ